jgi:hypothetical protein
MDQEPLLELLGELMLLGLAAPATREDTFATLLASDAAPRGDDLQALLDRVERGAWQSALLVVPRALELFALHFVHEAETIAIAVYEGAKALIAAVEQGIAWLAQQLEELKRTLERLVTEAGKLVEQITGELARLTTHLLTLEDAVLESIRAGGWAAISPGIAWAPGFVQQAARGVYDTAFDGAKWVLEAPLALLGQIATWVHEAVSGLATGGILSRAAIDQEIRCRVLGTSATDITIDLTVDLGKAGEWTLGKVTIPASHIVGALASVVLGDSDYGGAVDTVIARANELQGNQVQQGATRKAISGAIIKQDAQAAVGALTTGRALTVDLGIPSGTIRHDHAILYVRIEGANLAFVDTPLGVPRRVRVAINGAEYQYTAEQWKVDGQAIVLPLVVVPDSSGLVPASVEPSVRLTRMRLPVGATLTPDAGAGTSELTLSVDTAAPVPLPAPPAPPGPAAPPAPRAAPLVRPVPSLLPRAALGSGDLVAVPMSRDTAVTVSESQDTVMVATATGGRMSGATEAAQGWGWKLLGGSEEEIPSAYPVVVGNGGVNVIRVSASDGASRTASGAATFFLRRD